MKISLESYLLEITIIFLNHVFMHIKRTLYMHFWISMQISMHLHKWNHNTAFEICFPTITGLLISFHVLSSTVHFLIAIKFIQPIMFCQKHLGFQFASVTSNVVLSIFVAASLSTCLITPLGKQIQKKNY